MSSSYYIFHYGIPFFHFIKMVFNEIYYNYENVVKGYNSNIIVFYKNNPTPYLLSYINQSDNPVFVWKYNRKHNMFYSYNSSIHDYKHLPILSASILGDDSKVLYNLDDFINNLKINASNCNYPSIQQIIEVWSFSSGVVLDRSKQYTLEYMDTHVNVYSKNIFTDDFEFVEKQ